jgi:hypothetical protein
MAQQNPDQPPEATLWSCDWDMLKAGSFSALEEKHDVFCAAVMLLQMLLGPEVWDKLVIKAHPVTWAAEKTEVDVLFAEDTATWPEKLGKIREALELVQKRVGGSKFPPVFMDLMLGMVNPVRSKRWTWCQVAVSEAWKHARCEWSDKEHPGDWRELVGKGSAWGKAVVTYLEKKQQRARKMASGRALAVGCVVVVGATRSGPSQQPLRNDGARQAPVAVPGGGTEHWGVLRKLHLGRQVQVMVQPAAAAHCMLSWAEPATSDCH